MIFFKFNLLSFTITILAFSIIPAYTQNNCEDACSYVLMNYAGHKNDLTNDRQNVNNYSAAMENAQQSVKTTATSKISATCDSLGINNSVNLATIITNLIAGYNTSLYKKLTGNRNPVTTYCTYVCCHNDDINRSNFTTIENGPIIY